MELVELNETHLEFLLEVRNHKSTRQFLENDSIFDVEQCKEWFLNLKSPWFIIMVDNEPVGYIRTNGSDIGCDIHPNHRRKGYAKMAYLKIMENIGSATLWVFEDNFAKNLYQELGFKQKGEEKIIRGRKYIKMMYEQKNKVCYVVTFWLGERRFEYPEYKKDNLYFIKQQIKCLESYKQDLTKIIFNFNITSEHYKYFSEIFSIVPKQIQGAEVEINIRENIGISYGAWSDIFAKYTSEYDYYIFNEDDYFFVQDKWDTYLVNKYNSYEDCGYLCMVVQEPLEWNKFKKHAGSSNGIASTESLTKVFKKFNKLPHISHKQDDAYEGWGDVQLDFTFVFQQIGLNVYDVRDDYSILFFKSSPINPEIQNWRYFQWNSNYLNVSPFYFEETFSYWSSLDLEFTQEYKITSTEEAMYCYNNKLPYHDNEYDENGEFIRWVRREYPKNI